MKKLDFSYYTRKVFPHEFAVGVINVVSKPGLPNWGKITPSQQLLADWDYQMGGNIYQLGCGNGAVASCLSKKFPNSDIWVTDTSMISLNMTQETLQKNNIPNVQIANLISLLPQKQKFFNFVLIDLPKGRSLARRWLVEAFETLIFGGSLILAGAKNSGVLSVIKDGEDLFGNSTVLALKKGNRLVKFVKNERDKAPEWANKPGCLPGTWIEIGYAHNNRTFPLYSLPGVFSSDKIDPGTQFLLSNLSFPILGNVLDFGCGYGIIGIISALQGSKSVDLLDVDLYAYKSSSRNIESLGLKNVFPVLSDGLQAVSGKKYDLIISNPPFHAGKDIYYPITTTFLQDSYELLENHGRLIIVANQFLPYNKYLSNIYHRVTLISSNKSYNLWAAEK